MRRLSILVSLLALSALAFVPSATAQAQKQINVTGTGPGDYAFTPGSLNSGQTVLWENQTNDHHHAHADGEFDVEIPAGVGSRSPVVTISGSPRTIHYSCTIHPNMSGVLQVNAGSGTVATTAVPATTPLSSPSAGSTSRTTVRTGTTVRGSNTSEAVTPSSNNFDELTTTSEESTTTTEGQVAIKEKKTSGGGTSPLVIGALAVAIAAVLGGGGYGIFRLGARSAPAAAKPKRR